MSIPSNLGSRLVVSGTLILAVLIATATTPLHAQGRHSYYAEPHYYIGVTYGIDNEVDDDASSLMRKRASFNNVGVEFNARASGKPLGLVVGTQFNEYFSVEISTGQWSDWCIDATHAGSTSSSQLDGPVSDCVDNASYFNGLVRAGFQPTSWLYPYVSVGYQIISGDAIETERILINEKRALILETRREYQEGQLAFGGGVEIGPTDLWSIRVEYILGEDYYKDSDEETTMLGVGFIYRF